jgi:hypothetical protein
MLDAGSIEYFQEEEEYYNEGGIMLQDACLNHTAERTGNEETLILMVESRRVDVITFVS